MSEVIESELASRSCAYCGSEFLGSPLFCPWCGKAALSEADARPVSQQESGLDSPKHRSVGGLVLVLASAIVIACSASFVTWRVTSKPAPILKNDPRWPIGSNAWIYTRAHNDRDRYARIYSTLSVLCKTEHFPEYENLDVDETRQLNETLDIRDFTRVKVLTDESVGIKHEPVSYVEVLEGPLKGRAGWIMSYYLEKGEPPPS